MLKLVEDRVTETYQKFTSCSIPKEILYKTTLSKGWCTPITHKYQNRQTSPKEVL
jgi:hypothetical protein